MARCRHRPVSESATAAAMRLSIMFLATVRSCSRRALRFHASHPWVMEDEGVSGCCGKAATLHQRPKHARILCGYSGADFLAEAVVLRYQGARVLEGRDASMRLLSNGVAEGQAVRSTGHHHVLSLRGEPESKGCCAVLDAAGQVLKRRLLSWPASSTRPSANARRIVSSSKVRVPPFLPLMFQNAAQR